MGHEDRPDRGDRLGSRGGSRSTANGQAYADGVPTPVLHSWPLAIEEQWYLISRCSPAPSPTPVDSVLIVGDSVALSVLLAPDEPLCGDWDLARPGEIAAQPADVGSLYLGPWELCDRMIDDAEAPAGSREWSEATTRDYRRVLEELAPHVSRLAVVLNHCRGAPDTGLPVETMLRSGRYAPVVNDPTRIAETNAAVARAIAEFGEEVEVVDPGTLLHTDGVHFTEEGADLLWAWLVDELGLEG